MIPKKVFVGLSGGVDSSVAALLLKQQGYLVVGVFIKVWHPDFLQCNWEQERLDAMRVAAHLNIPFLTCDAQEAYKEEVANYFICEYAAGRTPNPDVMCNKAVKFGAFLKFAKANGADYIATGHYAQKIVGSNGPELHRGADNNKDQSYFLWSLTQKQLDDTLFPVGSMTKDVIRSKAAMAGIPTATKKDSQGICFLGKIDIKDFLSHYVALSDGDVLNEEGLVIGKHSGALIYTIGQRHGFTTFTHTESQEAFYVSAKDVKNNTITVCSTKPTLKEEGSLALNNVFLRTTLNINDECYAQTRYRQAPFKVKLIANIDSISKKFEIIEETDAVADGQSCVLYRGPLCLGGGIII